MKLRTKMALLLATTVLILGTALSVISTIMLSGSAGQELLEKGLSNVRPLAPEVANSLLEGDAAAILGRLNNFSDEFEETAYAFVIGYDGEVVAHTFNDGFPVDLLEANHVPPDSQWRVTPVNMGGVKVFDIGYRALKGSGAEIHLGLSGAGIAREAMRLRLTTLLLSLLAVIISIPVVVWVVAIFTRPLDELAGHAAAFGNTGVFRELPPSHGDEAGKLTATFNRMAENLSTMMRKMEYSERRYRMLVELAQEGMVAIDAKGIINFVNDRFVDMMGYSREELLGRIYRSFVAPEYKETIEGELRNRQEGITGRYDSSLIRKDGVRIHVIISGTPLYDDGGKFRGAFCLMTDITDRRRAEDAVKKANEDLRKQFEELKVVDRIKDGIIRDVTHELKTPVAKHAMQLEMLGEILQEEGILGKTRPILDVMDRSIRRQEAVIKNILNLSRLELGGRKYQLRELRLDELLEEVIGDYRQALDNYQIQFSADLPPITLRSDREMLWHVFSNILNNAIKYRSKTDRPFIAVTAGADGSEAVVGIADNGIGLEETFKERVFDRFFQVSAAYEGSGVGLTIARKIVDGLGGRITMESEGKNRGVSVTVVLPLGGPDRPNA